MFAKSLIVSLALTAASALDISTPYELKQCEEATFVITGATGSVWPFVVNVEDYCGDALRDLDEVNGDLKWKPDLSIGTKVQVMIEDEAENEAWSGVMVITAGSDSSCVKDPSSTESTDSPKPTPAPSNSTTDTGYTNTGYTNTGYTNTGNANTGGSDTPHSVANSAQNATAPTGDAAPAHVVAASGVTVVTVLSALALAL